MDLGASLVASLGASLVASLVAILEAVKGSGDKAVSGDLVKGVRSC